MNSNINKLKKYELFVHTHLGLCVMLSQDFDNIKAYLVKENRQITLYSPVLFDKFYSSDTAPYYSDIKELVVSGLFDFIFDNATKIKARPYYKEDAISNITYSKNKISASILGTRLYETSIEIINNVINMKCSCPVNGLCKHQYALTKKIINESNEDNIIEDNSNPLNNLFVISSIADIENVNKLEEIRIKLKDTPVEDIVRYFNSHPSIKEMGANYSHLLCAFDDEIYEKILKYINNLNIGRILSPFLSKLTTIRNNYYEKKNRSYYSRGEDPLKAFIYYCIKGEYEIAVNYLKELYHNQYGIIEGLVAFHFEELYQFNKDVIFEILNNHKNIVGTYCSLKDEELKKIFTIIYEKQLKKENIKLMELSDKDSFLVCKKIYEDESLPFTSQFVDKAISLMPFVVDDIPSEDIAELIVSFYGYDYIEEKDYLSLIDNLDNNILLKSLFLKDDYDNPF